MAEAQKPWYLRTSKRWQQFQDVPWKRLWLFAAAVFFLFSVIGFYNDLLRLGTIPYAIVLAIAFVCGLNAMLWIVVVSRFSWQILIPLILLQFVMGPLLTLMARWMGTAFDLKEANSTTGVRFAGTCILVVRNRAQNLVEHYLVTVQIGCQLLGRLTQAGQCQGPGCLCPQLGHQRLHVPKALPTERQCARLLNRHVIDEVNAGVQDFAFERGSQRHLGQVVLREFGHGRGRLPHRPGAKTPDAGYRQDNRRKAGSQLFRDAPVAHVMYLIGASRARL